VVWVHRWGTDSRAEIDGAGMVDPRVAHLWDTGGVVGEPFLERFGVDLGGLDYDFFLLFGPDASGSRHRRGRTAPAARSSAPATGWPAPRRGCSAERNSTIGGRGRG
jgi:hypothetical protein